MASKKKFNDKDRVSIGEMFDEENAKMPAQKTPKDRVEGGFTPTNTQQPAQAPVSKKPTPKHKRKGFTSSNITPPKSPESTNENEED